MADMHNMLAHIGTSKRRRLELRDATPKSRRNGGRKRKGADNAWNITPGIGLLFGCQ
ncbi:hypothetical protein K0M31_010852 [Melipona bicolor]|uniref:Uncharacterized protein n=1 Tax=Melipona bicolor TaxID=60889 RepID=A0AA40FLS1_9HYME|nr:hypothetical protein K0M31_010852 [Melipona bicolor]